MAFEEEFGQEISDSEAEKILTVGDAIKFIGVNQVKINFKFTKMKDNILVILSSPSGVGKTTLTKKFNKSINHLKFQYPTQLDLEVKRSRRSRLLFYLKQ